jgi:hypothetical protein
MVLVMVLIISLRDDCDSDAGRRRVESPVEADKRFRVYEGKPGEARCMGSYESPEL